MSTYKVILEGMTLTGFDRAAVAKKLGALTKQSEETAVRLLCGKPTVVKSRVDQATALGYQDAFRDIGVASRIEEVEILKLDIPDTPPSPAPQKLPSSTPRDDSAASRPQPTTARKGEQADSRSTFTTTEVKRSVGVGGWVVAIVMGFFSGLAIYFLAALLFTGREYLPSSTFVFMTFVGGWAASAYIMQKGAISITKVVSRGFLLGAAEWLLMIPAGMIFAGRLVASSSDSSSSAATAGAAIGSGIFAFLTGGVAVTMTVVCLIGFAVSYFIGREMKPEAPTATRKCPECAEMIQPDARKCRYCGAVF